MYSSPGLISNSEQACDINMMPPFCRTIYRGSVKLTDLQQLIQFRPAKKKKGTVKPNSPHPPKGKGTETVHFSGTRIPPLMTLLLTGSPKADEMPSIWASSTPDCSRKPCWHEPSQSPDQLPGCLGSGRPIRMLPGVAPSPKPPSLSGLYSQIFEICSSTESLSGDGLDGVLT